MEFMELNPQNSSYDEYVKNDVEDDSDSEIEILDTFTITPAQKNRNTSIVQKSENTSPVQQNEKSENTSPIQQNEKSTFRARDTSETTSSDTGFGSAEEIQAPKTEM